MLLHYKAPRSNHTSLSGMLVKKYVIGNNPQRHIYPRWRVHSIWKKSPEEIQRYAPETKSLVPNLIWLGDVGKQIGKIS